MNIYQRLHDQDRAQPLTFVQKNGPHYGGVNGEWDLWDIKWHRRFVAMAYSIASWSKDGHQVGSIAVSQDRREIVIGYNGYPSNIDDAYVVPNTDSELKRKFSIHAEANLMVNAHRSIRGWTVYSTFMPCLECAKMLTGAGIKRVCAPVWTQEQDDKYSFTDSLDLFTRANISVLLH